MKAKILHHIMEVGDKMRKKTERGLVNKTNESKKKKGQKRHVKYVEPSGALNVKKTFGLHVNCKANLLSLILMI